VTISDSPRLILRLTDREVEVSFPLSKIESFRRRAVPRRAIATRSVALKNVLVEDEGGTIEWPDLDVSFSVAEMLPEYLGLAGAARASAARKAGTVKSPAKARTSRENGKLGGRPRKAA
jgi:hypothetical protein